LPFAFRTDDLQAVLRGHQPAPPENRKAPFNTKPRGLFGETRGLWGDRSMASFPKNLQKGVLLDQMMFFNDHIFACKRN